MTLQTDPAQVDVSVVVATYNAERRDELDACLAALGRQTVAPVEVIVVVDHNPDLLAAARQAFPSATVIENRHARGLAGARNTGIDAARGSIVAFVDDDARPEADWLERLHDCFADPTAVGAGGALIPRWTNGMPRWLPTEFYWVFGCSYTGLPEQLAPVRNPIGANMAVRRKTLEEIGGFRAGGAGEEPRTIRSRGVVRAQGNVPDDTDLAIRVKQRWPDSIWLYQPEAKEVPVRGSSDASAGSGLPISTSSIRTGTKSGDAGLVGRRCMTFMPSTRSARGHDRGSQAQIRRRWRSDRSRLPGP